MTGVREQETRLSKEAVFQDSRMTHALVGEGEFRDKYYFINRRANQHYDELHSGLAGKRVVVVGCSDGGVTPLARQGVYVEGIDISAVSIDKLNRAIDQEGLRRFANARVMNAEALEYPTASVDAITCSGVLHHLNTESALRSWARCLKSDGHVIMFEPMAWHPFVALFRLVTPKMRTFDEHPLRGIDFALMHKYFGRIERRDYGLFTPLSAGVAVIPGLRSLAKLILPALEAMDSGALKILPFLRRFCWLTVVRLSEPQIPPAV